MSREASPGRSVPDRYVEEPRRSHGSHQREHRSSRERSPYRSSRSDRERSHRRHYDDDRERRRERDKHHRRSRDRDSYDDRSSYNTHRDSPTRSPSRTPSQAGPSTAQPSAQPNFERSGLLAKESNSVNGVALKYHEPPEAKKPKRSWRLFVFKDGKEVDMFVLGRQSCYLFGRDKTVVDIPIEHPSCSKQHAVIQFRQVTKRNEFGDEKRYVQPFLIDLESANGCIVNGENVPSSRYYELRSGDTCQFAASSREYVLLDEGAAAS